MSDQCWSCAADIDWAYAEHINETTGKQSKMPVDHASAGDPAGNLAVWRDKHGVLMFRSLRNGDEPGRGEKRAVSHYATCPARDHWRGKTRGSRE